MAVKRSFVKVVGAMALSVLTGVASAQSGRGSTPGQPGMTNGGQRVMDVRAQALNKLMKPITIELSSTRLEDVVTFVEDFAGVEIEPMWLEDKYATGLDKDTEIDLSVNNISVLAFIERVLEKADEDDFDRSAWQFARDGALEIGPRSRLNRKATMEVYDIREMLFELPNFSEVPSLDLDSVLQQSQQGGGGGGQQGIFQDNQSGGFSDLFPPIDEEGAQELIDVITTFVEPDEWEANGGTGGTIRFWKGNLLIRAPDYIHRQLRGYPWYESNPGVHRQVRRDSGVTLARHDPNAGKGDAGKGGGEAKADSQGGPEGRQGTKDQGEQQRE